MVEVTDMMKVFKRGSICCSKCRRVVERDGGYLTAGKTSHLPDVESASPLLPFIPPLSPNCRLSCQNQSKDVHTLP